MLSGTSLRPLRYILLQLVLVLAAAKTTLTASSSSPSPLDAGHYTTYDDASWAVVTANLSDPNKQRLYNDFMDGCRQSAGSDLEAKRLCDQSEEYRLDMNLRQPRSVRNYTSTGFLKMRAPDKVFSLIQDFWNKNRHENHIEWEHVNPYHNLWESPPTILRVDNRTLDGGGPQLQTAIANAARDAMEAWTGRPQSSTSVYGIRMYHNNSILVPHVDRLPLVSSCIINVAQEVDEPWMLEVYDHKGVAHNVTMEPGDLVLYESHSVIHGRPFPLRGNFFANIFVHFEPLLEPLPFNQEDKVAQDGDDEDNDNEEHEAWNIPPYMIPGSSWEKDYRDSFPDGWPLLNNPIDLVQKGDLRVLRYLGKVNPAKLNQDDGTKAEWKPIHEAARQGNVEILQYLVEEQDIPVNEPCKVTGTATALALAYNYHGADHEATKYLESKGGVELLEESSQKADEL